MPRSQLTVMSLLVNVVLVLSLQAPALAQKWQDIAAELMSPVCPGRTLLNCTSGQAEEWREIIRQKLARGETPEQIIQYFVGIRGEEILAAPPKRGFALTAWLFPLLVIINGAGLIVVLTYRWAKKRPPVHDNDADLTEPSSQSTVSLDSYRTQLQRELEEFTS